ncbi:hypothetical protein [Nitrosospira multiformis]|uniref:hypothetical protein n=1 Tax=Nitrosospira multiformis TaxID=1231 RepID=UPI001114503C|nr:hypothetical protein [Nitrosospira multiformis]
MNKLWLPGAASSNTADHPMGGEIRLRATDRWQQDISLPVHPLGVARYDVAFVFHRSTAFHPIVFHYPFSRLFSP